MLGKLLGMEETEGAALGAEVGSSLGLGLGTGESVGLLDGIPVGIGVPVGVPVGAIDGLGLGTGESVGLLVGAVGAGDTEGAAEGGMSISIVSAPNFFPFPWPAHGTKRKESAISSMLSFIFDIVSFKKMKFQNRPRNDQSQCQIGTTHFSRALTR